MRERGLRRGWGARSLCSCHPPSVSQPYGGGRARPGSASPGAGGAVGGGGAGSSSVPPLPLPPPAPQLRRRPPAPPPSPPHRRRLQDARAAAGRLPQPAGKGGGTPRPRGGHCGEKKGGSPALGFLGVPGGFMGLLHPVIGRAAPCFRAGPFTPEPSRCLFDLINIFFGGGVPDRKSVV